MTAETAFLALYFDAPLQSWGYQSRFDRRTTLSYPTRSGVIGLISAAMGRDWGDTDWLASLDTLRLTALVFHKGGRLLDFHTVGGGYDRTTQEFCIPHTAEGKMRGPGKETVPTVREYLEDARFGAVLEGSRAVLEQVAAALDNPQWGVWLGRKACIPAARICEGLYASAAEAEARLVTVAGGQPVRRIREATDFAEGTDTLMDRPMNFQNDQRDFMPRRVVVDETEP